MYSEMSLSSLTDEANLSQSVVSHPSVIKAKVSQRGVSHPSVTKAKVSQSEMPTPSIPPKSINTKQIINDNLTFLNVNFIST